MVPHRSLGRESVGVEIRHPRVAVDPAAWIRWLERVSIALEPYGLRVEGVPIGELKDWFERGLSPRDVAVRIRREYGDETH